MLNVLKLLKIKNKRTNIVLFYYNKIKELVSKPWPISETNSKYISNNIYYLFSIIAIEAKSTNLSAFIDADNLVWKIIPLEIRITQSKL